MAKGVHKLQERRHVRVACLGHDRDRIVQLTCRCIDIARPDDGFEFMVDSSRDTDAAFQTAVVVETLWNDLPNPSLAHLCDQRHMLLLGADVVVDLTACADDRADGGGGLTDPQDGGDASGMPEIIDWDAPRLHCPSHHDATVAPEQSAAALMLDMSLLCPRAILVRVDPGRDAFGDVVAALEEALRRAELRPAN